MIPDTKWIPVSEGIVGKKYYGYQRASDNHIVTTFGRSVYSGNGFVDGDVKASKLEVKLTWEEQEKLIKNMFHLSDPKTQLNLYGLFTDLYDFGDATHEMWNGWLDCNWYNINAALMEEDFYIVGIAPISFRGGFRNPVAVVCEDENGFRFWCHAEKEWIDRMREQMRDAYESLKAISR